MKRAALVCTPESVFTSAVAAAVFAAGVRSLVVCHPDNVILEGTPTAPQGVLWRVCLHCGIEYLPRPQAEVAIADYESQIARDAGEGERVEARQLIEFERANPSIVIGRHDSADPELKFATVEDLFGVIVGAAKTTGEVDDLITKFLQAARARFEAMLTPPQSAPLSILYVEDDKSISGIMRITLEEAGWAVDLCESGAVARDKLLGATRYDVLLLDYELPGMSGLDLARLARSLVHRREAAIIMLSGSSVEREARDAGVDVFLAKPDGAEQVVASIQHLRSFANHA